MYIDSIDAFLLVCVCVVLQWFLKHMARLFSLRCWDDPGTTGVYIQTYDIYIRIGNIISRYIKCIYLFDNSSCFRHARFAYCWNLRSHRKLRKMSSKCSGCSGYYRIKVSSTQLNPRQISKIIVIVLCSYDTGYMLQHLFAFKKRWEATLHGCDFIYAVAMKTTTIRP